MFDFSGKMLICVIFRYTEMYNIYIYHNIDLSL